MASLDRITNVVIRKRREIHFEFQKQNGAPFRPRLKISEENYILAAEIKNHRMELHNSFKKIVHKYDR